MVTRIIYPLLHAQGEMTSDRIHIYVRVNITFRTTCKSKLANFKILLTLGYVRSRKMHSILSTLCANYNLCKKKSRFDFVNAPDAEMEVVSDGPRQNTF